ncbi:hypothetical protein COZ82_00500 [Candidatus Kaiserbacteria bacterium CG_4_8_14_3_um_filter_38_9]|uniref:AbiEi antitoxin C-terminal domain-containing protein n=1 Tax=Candidatus Kaiserbacteria bacterium CG_4_8_14_3_um_filter_38_9 TaxID=1974599 RepID=A0A2M7IPK0_9BACT|nr:MAG: hypothetical protein COZ82_00500 [Candidatus Kaiserbacteria bacterium CG_4_8_14_3_um_filter_38_9]
MKKKPIKGEFLEVLLRSPQTIFSTKEVALLWGESNDTVVSRRLNSYAQVGKLVRVRRALYAKDRNYNRWELATRIYTPAYISFETVLAAEGIVFQFYGNIFVASYLEREINADGQKISLVRMKDYVLSNIAGIIHKDGVAIATKERAFLDRLYVSKKYHFDNLPSLDWNKIFELLPIYRNKRLEKKVREYYQQLEK